MSRPASSNHELAHLESEVWREVGHELQTLPRVDGGKQAWLFLSACFMLEALVWGETPALKRNG